MNTPAVVVTFIGLALPVIAPSMKPHVGRRLFWSGLAIAVVSGFFIAYPPGWKDGLVLSLLIAFLMLGTAYFTSPYLRFRGRTVAYYNSDARPDRSRTAAAQSISVGGLTTAPKFWWLMVVGMAICSVNVVTYVVDGSSPRLAAVMALVIATLGAVFGFLDGRARNALAQGQSIQFALVAIVTAAVFTVFYAVAYLVGKGADRSRSQKGGGS